MMLKALRTYIDAVHWLIEKSGLIAGWLCTALVLLVSWNVLFSYLVRFSADWEGGIFILNWIYQLMNFWAVHCSIKAQEIEQMLFGALIVLGAAFTLKHNRHVRVDLLYSRFSSRYRHLIDFLGAVLLLMLMAAVIGYQSFIDAQDAFAIDERSTDGKIPRGLIYSVIPLGFLLLFLQASVMAVTNFCHICKIKLTDPDQGPDNEAGRAGQ